MIQKKATLFGAAATLGLLLAACGSSGSSSSGTTSGGSATTGAATTAAGAATTAAGAATTAAGASAAPGTSSGGPATGEPIKVTVISQLQATGFAFPEIQSASKILVDELNQSGGIKGRPVEFTYCNDKGNPNDAATCARQAVSNGSVAVMAPFTLFAGSITPVLEQAGLAYVGNNILSPEDAQSKVAFPVTGGTISSGIGVGEAFVDNGCKKAGAVGFTQAASDTYVNWVKKGMQSKGGDLTTTQHVGQGLPNYAPAVAALESAGVGCIFMSLPPAEAGKFVGAVAQSGKKILLGTGMTTLPQAVVSQLQGAADGAVLTGTSYNQNDTQIPEIKSMVDNFTSKGMSKTDMAGSFLVATYGADKMLFHAMSGIDGDITKESVLKQMGTLDDPGTTVFGPFSTKQESGIKGFERIFNFNVLNYKVDNGKITLVSPDFHDTSAVAKSSS